MSRPSPEIAAALLDGYNAATGDKCPHIWSSAMWEAWQMGDYLRTTGRAAPLGIEKRRGNTYETADGFTFRAYYSKQRGGGATFSIGRVA